MMRVFLIYILKIMKNALQCFTHVYINYCHRIDDVIRHCTVIDDYSLNRFTHQKWNTFNILHHLSVGGFLNQCMRNRVHIRAFR